MKILFFTFTLSLLLCFTVFGQQQGNATIKGQQNSNSVLKNGVGELNTDTQIAAQLQSTLDVKKAKIGDEVVLKTKEAIRSNGQVVVKKGAHLIGRITDIKKKSKDDKESHITLLFDKLANGSQIIQINASITSISQTAGQTLVNSEPFGVETGQNGQNSASANSSTNGKNQDGILLGGVSKTVGGVLNTTTKTVDNTVANTSNTVASTSQTFGNTLGKIQISNSTEVNAEGNTTISLSGENLKLEKGTTFHLRLTESANIKKN